MHIDRFKIGSVMIYARTCTKSLKTRHCMFVCTDKSINFQLLARSNMLFILIMGLAAFLTQLALLHILRYSHTIAALATTLEKSARDVLNSLFCIFIVMTAFASYMHIEYGHHLSEYRSLILTYAAQMSGFMGTFDYPGIYEAQGTLGAFMLILYLLIINHLFLNLFISILSDYMSAIRKDPETVPDDHEVITHAVCMIQDTIGMESEEAKQRRLLAEKLSKSSVLYNVVTFS